MDLINIIARVGYAYLFLLSTFCFVMSIRIGVKLDSCNCAQNIILQILYLMILGLSIIQAYQSLLLLASKLSVIWFVPLICKNLSLVTYVVVLRFIEYQYCLDSNTQCHA